MAERTIRMLSLILVLLLAWQVLPVAAQADGTEAVLEGGEKLDWVCGVPFTDPGCRVPKGSTVSAEGEVCVWRPGYYTIRYRVTEQTGAEHMLYRRVHVIPAQLPETVPVPKAVYLTFDDGPSEFTANVLDTLAAYGAKATFFIVAKSVDTEEERALLRRIVREGHSLGIHCYEHVYERIYQNEEHFFQDLLRAQEVIYAATGQYATVTRFPGGSRTAGMMVSQLPGKYDELNRLMHGMGLRYYDWSIQPELGKSAYQTVYNFSHPKEPYSGDISLQHDTREFSVKAVDEMLAWGTAQGYVFLPIDTTTPEIHFR
ncbi:MAG: polysaccharide deacetylase family protein [Oscillospiraceae bacterium]|nr:polysaccharide deacetylase family protein [Oscillospiraceae bacterium]